ncbi:unnamed protein product [Microthlaspi erraticum]|uniref:Uncharacterized protein n=1 Tax=Microthlaspi erraticum TaxID=1685480 RepID=A0A6D2IHL3_9BRAS|nr:unnamed protein product [Microthlaspi erraticum]
MTLFPTKFENGKIEYKIRYKGRSRPFSRAKALVTSEQSRDPTKLKELLSQVLTITLDGDKGASSTDSSIELETGQLDRVPQLDQGRRRGESRVEESEHESNENVPMEEEESEEEEDELPMYQEHYDALFSMDFVETKYPHDDTMRLLGSLRMWSWSSRTCAWPSSSLTAGVIQGAHLLGMDHVLGKGEKVVTFRQLEILFGFTYGEGTHWDIKEDELQRVGLQSLRGTLPQGQSSNQEPSA